MEVPGDNLNWTPGKDQQIVRAQPQQTHLQYSSCISGSGNMEAFKNDEQWCLFWAGKEHRQLSGRDDMEGDSKSEFHKAAMSLNIPVFLTQLKKIQPYVDQGGGTHHLKSYRITSAIKTLMHREESNEDDFKSKASRSFNL